MSEITEIVQRLQYEAETQGLDEVINKLKQIEELAKSISNINVTININVQS